MSQEPSAGVANHSTITSAEAQYYPRHDASTLNATTGTDAKDALEATTAKMNLESSTSQMLDNVSSSDRLELKAPDNPSQSGSALHESPDVDDLSKLILDMVLIGGDGGTVNAENSSSVAPPTSIVRPLKNIKPSTQPQPSTIATTTTSAISHNTQHHCQTSIPTLTANPQISSDHATSTNFAGTSKENMNVVKIKVNHRKMARVKAHPNALTVYEAELTSKDRATQKEAVRQYLENRVKQDWNWVRPAEEDASIDIMEALAKHPSSDNLSNTSTNSPAYKEEWRQRDEWESDPSESEGDNPTSPKGPVNINSPDKESPFRFDSPDGVGQLVKQRRAARRRKHKKKLAAEMEWNTGVHCYVERRDAWTCARHVAPAAWRDPGAIEKTQAHTNGSLRTAVVDSSDEEGWDTEVPIAKPLLPPDNAMRSSITSQAYSTIYDKVILQSMTPSCPINLSDVIQSCVQGWKRDGEWPPTSSVPEPGLAAKKKQRRLSMLNILGLNQPTIPGGSTGADKSPQTPNSIKKGLKNFWKRGDKIKGGPEGGTGA
ncbi:hypothetical protein SBOR_7036 [Sclerotinia borealis F-4128]|uniref:Gag1-like clamp domain-containing protein n=1 Tax=Sclerotinia borealis (strain F-4128) TaxID=1432307 RepID=W9C9Q4_SCLBF|nr:hypothetical protein SBOR_7036 [Sclerotinia borealis F-4128]